MTAAQIIMVKEFFKKNILKKINNYGFSNTLKFYMVQILVLICY
jgi:hypothetical protein